MRGRNKFDKMTKEKFIHGKDKKAAEQYLKDIGVYDKVIETSVFKGAEFEIIIAANIEYNVRNKKEEV